MDDLFRWATNGETCVMIQLFENDNEERFLNKGETHYYLVEAFTEVAREILEDYDFARKSEALRKFVELKKKYGVVEEN